MSQKNYLRHNCPIAQTLGVVGGQWTLLIARNLINGINKFDGIQKNLNISRNLLTKRLKYMELSGLTKKTIPDGKRRAIYLPTKKCFDLTNTLLALSEWSEKWIPDPSGPRIYVSKKTNGKPLKLALIPAEKLESYGENEFQLDFGTAKF